MAWHNMQKQLDKNRRPEDIRAARAENALASAIFPASTWKAGQSSLSAAREDEIRVRDNFMEALAHLRSVAQDTESATDLPQIKKAMGEFIRSLDDAVSDAGITRNEWTAKIEEMV
jgi:hypothetical protein